MSWVLISVATWLVLGVAIALLIGKGIHRADVEATADDGQAAEPNVVDDLSPLTPPREFGAGHHVDGIPPAPRSPGTPGEQQTPRAPLHVVGTGGPGLDDGRRKAGAGRPARRPGAR